MEEIQDFRPHRVRRLENSPKRVPSSRLLIGVAGAVVAIEWTLILVLWAVNYYMNA